MGTADGVLLLLGLATPLAAAVQMVIEGWVAFAGGAVNLVADLIRCRTDSTFHDEHVKQHEKPLKAQSGKATPWRRGQIACRYRNSIIDRLAAKDALFAGDDARRWCGRWVSTERPAMCFEMIRENFPK